MSRFSGVHSSSRPLAHTLCRCLHGASLHRSMLHCGMLARCMLHCCALHLFGTGRACQPTAAGGDVVVWFSTSVGPPHSPLTNKIDDTCPLHIYSRCTDARSVLQHVLRRGIDVACAIMPRGAAAAGRRCASSLRACCSPTRRGRSAAATQWSIACGEWSEGSPLATSPCSATSE